MGGALLIALYPTLPNEASMTMPSAIQSFLYGIYESSVQFSRLNFAWLELPRALSFYTHPYAMLEVKSSQAMPR